MVTVALGEFGAIMRLGLRTVLDEAGCHVLADGGAVFELERLLRAQRLDAVLLNLDAPLSGSAAAALGARHPEVRVIECSALRPVMRLRSGGRRVELDLTAEVLRDALTGPPPACGPWTAAPRR